MCPQAILPTSLRVGSWWRSVEEGGPALRAAEMATHFATLLLAGFSRIVAWLYRGRAGGGMATTLLPGDTVSPSRPTLVSNGHPRCHRVTPELSRTSLDGVLLFFFTWKLPCLCSRVCVCVCGMNAMYGSLRSRCRNAASCTFLHNHQQRMFSGGLVPHEHQRCQLLSREAALVHGLAVMSAWPHGLGTSISNACFRAPFFPMSISAANC